MKEGIVLVVGAGPSGIATSACLNHLSVPNMLIEREDCVASLWKKKSYDRLHLHLPKQFCQLPHMPFPKDFPTYVPKNQFIQYLDDYVEHFDVKPLYNRLVESATFDGKWHVEVKNMSSKKVEEYKAKFLVVATGETSDVYIPRVEGLDNFNGKILHSTEYKSGEVYRNQNVLVVGFGNSGMEIALDLANFGAKTSIVVRSPVHILNKEMMYLGVKLFYYLPLNMVDGILVFLSKLVYGDITKYGITRPKEGPSYLKAKYGKFPVLDVGTIAKIKSGEIQVLPSITKIMSNSIEFANGKTHQFDAIVFATGFKRSTSKWLKDENELLDEDGIAKLPFPNHWKGENGLYCVGLSKRGLYGAGMDAQNVAADIKAMM
ncbi:indole-3-pyruvate monooxygenase [Ranunculus cassubicifolius]